ncbi:response regulator [uncultured Paraglaciecola sp.]|uniref:tetratricopeptide repeat-containing hybrid sensor histidine kinase/response regulator n=1 Tax=uncultured Paraglaciecola sp. TaxID=1765024 RepID=UPI0025976A17|nr:response regulator [uncultured Paraglaciecola sp.]
MNKFRYLVVLCLLGSVLNCLPAFANDAEVKALLDKAEINLLVNISLAESLLSEVTILIKKAENNNQESRLLNLQAHVDLLNHNLNDAYAKAKKAEKLALNTDNQLQLAEAFRKQGIINFLLDFDADALALLTKSLTLHEQLNSKYVLHNLQAIGNVYAKNDDWADSLIDIGQTLVKKALVQKNLYYEEQGYSFVISGLIKQGSYKEASVRATKILQILNTPEEERVDIYSYAALAESKLKNYKVALSYINKQLELTKSNVTTLGKLHFRLLKAEILLKDNQKTIALPLFQQALIQANKYNFSNYQGRALKGLANYYEMISEPSMALKYFKQYEALKEKSFNAIQAEQLAFSRASLELAQKDKQISDLELSQQLHQQQHIYQLIFIGLSSAIIILLLFMYWRSSKQKRVLREYSSNLKQASEAKSEFLARMSHEIRTPINAIIGLTKLNRKPSLSQHQKDTNLQQIEESSNTLLVVINDILDFSKIEAGHLHIESVEFELDKVVNQAMRLLTLKAQKKDLELIEYIARDVPLLLKGDALRIQQVLNNLLSNAVKFTHHGVVSVSVNKKYSESKVLLEFAVKDTGIGIKSSHLDTLFDPFTQADESTTRRFGGTGLGLTISKQLVELMGGEIWAESLLGQGSTFYFTIKVTEAIHGEQTKSLSEEHLSMMKVLLVDDVELSRQAASNALFRLDITPDVAENGTQAINKIRSAVEENSPYQLIILDWKMPDIDGIEVASIIKQSFSPKPQIIMLSAYDMDTLQELGKPLGLDAYLQKPINSSNLLNAILRLTNKIQKIPSTKKIGAPKIPNLCDINILLVEDNELNRKVAKGFLADTNADIAVAENGQIALQMLKEAPLRYGLILMDIQMPVMDGLTVTYKIRNELHLKTPIIAMTAHAMAGDINKSLDAGMNAHITKPIDPDYLYKVLINVLSAKSEVTNFTPLKDSASHFKALSLTHVDFAVAKQQLRLDDHSYWELVNDFIKLESSLHQLTEAIKDSDIDKINKIIHLYSPSLAYIGANQLANLANQILDILREKEVKLTASTMELVIEFHKAALEVTKTLKLKTS